MRRLIGHRHPEQLLGARPAVCDSLVLPLLNRLSMNQRQSGHRAAGAASESSASWAGVRRVTLRPRVGALVGVAIGLIPTSAHAIDITALGDTLRGHVEDTIGVPIRGADITIIEIGRRTVTDEHGAFVFFDVPPGQYSLLARAAGFNPTLAAFTIPGRAGLTIRLASAALELPPVTVTAVRNALDPRLAALPTDEVGPEQLRREHGVSLAHALEGLAGVSTLSTGEQVGKPVIRGLTGSRVLVMTNGLRLEDYSWSDEDGPSVDVRLADRVEVIRGPVSVLYGSDALGGVVNVIPEPLPDGLGRPSYLDGRVEAYGASNNHEAGGVMQLEGGAGGFGWRVMGVGRFADDYRTPTGPVENTGFGSFSGEAAGGVRGGWGTASLRLTHFGGEFKLLEADAPPPVEGALDKGPERKAADDRLQLSATLPTGEHLRLEGKAQWQRHSLIELGDAPGGTPGQETTQFDLLLTTATVDLLAHHEIGSGVVGTAGVSGLTQRNDSRGPLPIVPDGRARSAAVFLFEQVPAGPVRLSIGGRVDLRRLEVDPNAAVGNPADTRTYTVASGGIGAAYAAVSGVLLRANIGRAWRAPTLFELYSNGPRIGEALYEVGRADLTPESSLDVDLGVEYSLSILRLAISAYRNRINDFIFLAPTESFVDGLRVYQHDQAPALLWGGEVSVDVRPTAALTLHGRADYVHGANTATDEPLPLIAPPSGAVRAEVAGELAGSLGRSYVGVETEGFAKQTRLSSFDYQTDGYVLVHVEAGVAPRLGQETVQVDVQLRNLFDTSYRSYLSRYKEFALNPGRSLLVRVGMAF